MVVLAGFAGWVWFGEIGRSYRASRQPPRVFYNRRWIGWREYFPIWRFTGEYTAAPMDGAAGADEVFVDVRSNFVLVFKGGAGSFREPHRVLTERTYKLWTRDAKFQDEGTVKTDVVRLVTAEGATEERKLRPGAAAAIETVLERREAFELATYLAGP